MEELRFPAVSGKYYPLDPAELSEAVHDYIKSAAPTETDNSTLKALIVPHSGYQFCGEILGSAYAQIVGKVIDEVFLIGSSHFHQLDKTAFSDFRYWQTPLGKVEQSHRITQIVESDDTTSKDLLRYDNDKHHGEHTIEIHLPFLQELISGDFRIIPMLAGEVSPRLLAKSLEKLVDPDDLLIVSGELSHAYPEEYAKDIDKLTINAIESLDGSFIEGDRCEVSNKVGISTLINLARLKDWKCKLLAYDTSASSSGEKSKVSGYAAFGFYS